MFSLVASVLSGSRRRGRKVQEFTRQLAALLKSGLNEAEALRALVLEMPLGRFRTVLCDVLNNVEQGVLLSCALQPHPRYFGGDYVSMVSAGERSGSLAETMAYLVELERRPNFGADKLFLAIIVPARLLFYLAAVMAFLAAFIMPKFGLIFADYEQEWTGAAPSASPLIRWVWRDPGHLMLAVVLVVAAIIIFFDLRYYRPARKSLVLARLATSLRVMLNANVPLDEIEGAVAGLSPSRAYRAAIGRLFAKLEAGESLSDAFRAERYFPGTFQWLIASGEFQGNLATPLGDLAGIYAVRADAKLSTILNLMPPIITVCLGVVVGMIGYTFFSLLVHLMRHLS
jgi:type II secretory pathway component PulF